MRVWDQNIRIIVDNLPGISGSSIHSWLYGFMLLLPNTTIDPKVEVKKVAAHDAVPFSLPIMHLFLFFLFYKFTVLYIFLSPPYLKKKKKTITKFKNSISFYKKLSFFFFAIKSLG